MGYICSCHALSFVRSLQCLRSSFTVRSGSAIPEPCLLPGLRSPDLGCPLLPCATRLSPTESSASAYGKLRFSPTESSASAYGKLRFCLRKLRLCPTESSASAYGSSASVLRKAPFSFSLCITSVINSFSATESSRLHCDTATLHSSSEKEWMVFRRVFIQNEYKIDFFVI